MTTMCIYCDCTKMNRQGGMKWNKMESRSVTSFPYITIPVPVLKKQQQNTPFSAFIRLSSALNYCTIKTEVEPLSAAVRNRGNTYACIEETSSYKL